MKKFLAPIIWILWAIAPVICYGLFESRNEESLDVWLVNNMWVLLWPAGVITGYLIWDITQPLDSSYIRTWWRRFRNKDPLGLYVDMDVTESPNGDVSAEIFAMISNDSDKRVSKACITAEKMPCDGGDVEFIEFCADVSPREQGLKIPLFEVHLLSGANIAKYRILSRYLKSNHSTDWCSMTEMAFQFEPCFSSDTQTRDCEVHCNVVAPFSAIEPIKIFQAYGSKK